MCIAVAVVASHVGIGHCIYALLAQLTHTTRPTSRKIKDTDFVSNKNIYNNYKKKTENETIVHSVVHRWIHKFTTRVWRIRTVTKEQNRRKTQTLFTRTQIHGCTQPMNLRRKQNNNNEKKYWKYRMKQEQKKLHKISAHFYRSATKIAQRKKRSERARANKKLHTTKDKRQNKTK